jgi:Flp pilus assembly protein TadG
MIPSKPRPTFRLLNDCRGVSAVEFAIVLPIMLTLYIGSVELGEGISVQYKSTLAARTIADLASQYTSIDSPTMSEILGAPSQVMTPYSAANMSVTVSEVTTNANAVATITWSAALNATAHPVGQVIALPTYLQIPNISLIWGEVTFPYTPSIGYAVTGTINLYESEYFFPRKSSCVSYNSTC